MSNETSSSSGKASGSKNITSTAPAAGSLENSPAGEGQQGGRANLCELRLLRGVAPETLAAPLARCELRRLSPGDVLLVPGQVNRNLYLLLAGRLQVHLDAAESDLGFEIPPGECIGEMSIIDGQPVSAYVVAEDASTVMSVPGDIFWAELAVIPGVIRNLLEVLAERIRRNNEVTLHSLERQLRLEHINKELACAREIQFNMLPQQVPLFPEHRQLDVSALMEPAKEVGGDFFDAFALDDQRVAIAIGDVTGKGMPAALFMVRALTLLRSEMLLGGAPNEVLYRVNNILAENNPRCTFVTLFLAVVHVPSGEIAYAGGGHNPPLHLHRAAADFLMMPDGPVLGVCENASYGACRMTLRRGDLLLLYTDGVTEARNEEHAFFTDQRLREAVADHAQTGASELVRSIRAQVRAFAGRSPQSDDITLLALRYRS